MFRQKFLGFTGGVMIAYGIILTVHGLHTAGALYNHAAAGVPLWCGLLFVLTGCGNLAEAMAKKKKRADDIPFSITVILCNFVALLIAAICIGFMTWGAWTQLDNGVQVGEEQAVEVYSAVMMAAILILILSTIAMFVDCCSFSFGGVERPTYYADYPPRQVPAIYKA